MRFIGVLLILAGLSAGYELVYKGKSIQQMGADLGAFFHVPKGSAGSASQGWSGWNGSTSPTENFTGNANSDTQPLSNRSAGNLALGF